MAIDDYGNPIVIEEREMTWDEKLAARHGAPRCDSESSSSGVSLAGMGFDPDEIVPPPSTAGSSTRSDAASSSTHGPASRAAARPSLLSRMEMVGPPSANHFDPSTMSLPARIETLDTGADWFYVPNPVEVFQQSDKYVMDFRGVPLQGVSRPGQVDWVARAGDPPWFPLEFRQRLSKNEASAQDRVEMLFRVGGPFHTLVPFKQPRGVRGSHAGLRRQQEHDIPADRRLTTLTEPDKILEKWAMNVRLVLMKAHGRAALSAVNCQELARDRRRLL
ncbi:hypothetical protein AURDEDRAFT_178115 [Auricularia subglabra TFB-10046 SS5]|uniref:Uncharacterized protein n=1 Tax=Auricularia subglabra (strain TFB-10046 / SS5) TaxID=717982 RepID=J0L8T9_AURST|nr:hypothetical protein AURDEDRAFT_178115 [Auricularia subglabra TFB-10046 SS5]